MPNIKPVFNYVSQLAPPIGPTIFDQSRLVFLQTGFQGGLNQLQDPTRIQPNQYSFLVNGRVRQGVVQPIRNIVQLQGLPYYVNAQGLYAASNFLLFFADGKAYYYQLGVTNPQWIMIVTNDQFKTPLQLNSQSARIYACLVPASSVNYTRVSTSMANPPSPTSPVNLTTAFTGSIECIVCQDGTGQPWLIFNDGTCRLAQTFNQWMPAFGGGVQEYIPIGTIMAYIDGILYLVSGNIILRSVQGRPVDFVIAVDSNGASVAGQDAYATSTGVSYENITAIQPTNSPDGSFLVASLNNIYSVAPNTNVELFDEPTFTATYLYNSGVLNDKSIVDIIGDTATIDYTGVYSLNAVAQYRFEGRNAPFTKNIQRVLEGITQTTITINTGTTEETTSPNNTIGLTAAIVYNDYALFSLLTNYGNVVLVYDIILGCWVSIDIFSELVNTSIIQFAVAKLNGIYSLYFLTLSGKIFQYYGSINTYATTQLYVGEWNSIDPKIEQKPEEVRCIFINTTQEGTVTFQLIVDGKLSSTVSKTLAVDAPFNPAFPIGLTKSTSSNVDKITATLDDSIQGFKSGLLISWNFNTQLSHVRLEAAPILGDLSDQQAAENYNANPATVYND